MNDARAWNATPDDVARTYGCDALDFPHDDVLYRAIDISASADRTFRWLCQLRIAPYSYDMLDNFGHKSPPRLTPGLDELAPGQRFMTIFELVSFERPRELTMRLRSRLYRALVGDIAGSYAVVPLDGNRVRIVAKILVRYPPGPLRPLFRCAMPHIDLFMFRKQLRTLRAYIEDG